MKDKYKLIKQKEILATYYPKRSPEDSLINWNDSMDNILKLIKASTTPFNGAFTYLDKKKLTVLNASKFFDFKLDNFFKKMKNGQICDVLSENNFIIKVKDGVILVNDYKGTNILNSHKNKILNNHDKIIKKFKKNNFGNYDLKLKYI